MGSATQKAKPRREAVSEPGGKRVFKFMSRLCSQKNSKKACHLFTSAINPGRKKEKVLTRFWHFRYKQHFTLKFHPHHNHS